MANEGKTKADILTEFLWSRPSDKVIRWQDLPLSYADCCARKDRVAKRLESGQQRTIATVRGEGWMLVKGMDHAAISEKDRRQGIRKLRRGVHRIDTVDRTELSGEEQARLDLISIRNHEVMRAAEYEARRKRPFPKAA